MSDRSANTPVRGCEPADKLPDEILNQPLKHRVPQLQQRFHSVQLRSLDAKLASNFVIQVLIMADKPSIVIHL